MMRPLLFSGQCKVIKFTMLQARGSLSKVDVYSRSVKGGGVRGSTSRREEEIHTHELHRAARLARTQKSWRTTHIRRTVKSLKYCKTKLKSNPICHNEDDLKKKKTSTHVIRNTSEDSAGVQR